MLLDLEHNEHIPDITKISSALTGLAWQTAPREVVWCDGDLILTAIPIVNGRKKDGWIYEHDVVRIRCDEDYFSVECICGEPWGWDFDMIDFFVML